MKTSLKTLASIGLVSGLAFNAAATDDLTPEQVLKNGYSLPTDYEKALAHNIQLESKKLDLGEYGPSILQVEGDYVIETNFTVDGNYIGTNFEAANSVIVIDCDNGADCDAQSTVTDSNANSVTNISEGGDINSATNNENNSGDTLNLLLPTRKHGKVTMPPMKIDETPKTEPAKVAPLILEPVQ